MTADERFDRIDDTIARLTRYMLEFREETARRLDVIDQRLDFLSHAVVNLDGRLPPLNKAILDFGSVAAQLTKDHAETAARQSRLEDQVSKHIDPAA